MTNHLPLELISSNILTRLPVKSLLRFSSVSKHWCTTIADPSFISSHFAHAKQSPPLTALFLTQEDNLYICDYLYLKEDDHNNEHFNCLTKFCTESKTPIHIVGDCDGLTCILSLSSFKICNPSTHEFLTHPLPFVLKACQLGHVSHGFGFDPLTNEYKFLQVNADGPCKCMVYTLGNNSWRDITLSSNLAVYAPSFPISDNVLHSNRALHWFCYPANIIISFDLHYEKFLTIPGPRHLLDYHDSFVRQECLCLAFHDEDNDPFKINLYTLTLKVDSHNDHVHHHHSWVKETVTLPFRPPSSFSFLSYGQTKQVLLEWVSEGYLTLYYAHMRRQKKLPLSRDAISFKQCGAINQVEMYYAHIRSLKKVPLPSYSISLKQCGAINQVENLRSLKTFVPPGASEVRYTKVK